jgi:hypothetical protein
LLLVLRERVQGRERTWRGQQEQQSEEERREVSRDRKRERGDRNKRVLRLKRATQK